MLLPMDAAKEYVAARHVRQSIPRFERAGMAEGDLRALGRPRFGLAATANAMTKDLLRRVVAKFASALGTRGSERLNKARRGWCVRARRRAPTREAMRLDSGRNR